MGEKQKKENLTSKQQEQKRDETRRNINTSCVSINLQMAQIKIRTENTPNGNISLKKKQKNKHMLSKSFYARITLHFGQKLRRKCFFSAAAGHMVRLSVRTGSNWLCGTSLIIQDSSVHHHRSSCIVGRVRSGRFWLHSSSMKSRRTVTSTSDTWPLRRRRVFSSHNTPTLPSLGNNDSECSCCNGNEPARSENIHASRN